MTSKLKCPFCGGMMEECKGELHDFYGCHKTSCFEKYGWFSASVLQALIQEKQDLEIAVDALNAIIATPLNSRVIHDVANKALTQIEHKEKQNG